MMNLLKISLLVGLITLSGGLVFADTVQIGSGSSSSDFLPIYGVYGYNFTQQIYVKQQINTGGQIRRIRFFYMSGDITNSRNWVIYLGHTYKSGFDSNTDWVPVSNQTQVFSGDLSSLLPAANNWLEIPLDTGFNYNNIQNLVVTVFENTPGFGSMSWGGFTCGTNTAIYYYHDSFVPNPQSPPQARGRTNNLARIQLVFPDTSVPQAPNLLSPASGSTAFVNTTLKWVPAESGASSALYDVYLGSEPDPPLVSENQSSRQYSANLEGHSTYYWKVVAKNAIGSSPPSQVFNFTTNQAGLMMVGSGTQTQRQPWGSFWGFERHLSLYTQEQISSFGKLDSAAWYCQTPSSAAIPYKIYAKSTEANQLTPITWEEFKASATLLKEGSHTFNHGQAWHSFAFDSGFNYVSGNLLIGIETNFGGNGTIQYPLFQYSPSMPATQLVWNSDNLPPIQTGALSNNQPNILLHLSELSMAPELSVYPHSLDFDTQAQGFPSAWKLVTLTNAGMGTLNLDASNLSVTGPHASMFEVLDLTLPAALESNQSVILPVRLNASAQGVLSATLRISFLGETYNVELGGFGLPEGMRIVSIGQASSIQRYPLGSYYGYERSAALYTADEIGPYNSGISTLFWYPNAEEIADVPTRIYLKSYPYPALETASWNQFLTDATLVFDQTMHRLVPNAWKEIPLNQTFRLDEGSHLLVLVERNAGGNGNGSYYGGEINATLSPGKHLAWYQDNSPPLGVGLHVDIRPDIRFYASGYSYNAAPYPAQFSAPAHQAGMVALKTTLSWTSGGGAPSGFKLYFGTQPDPSFVADLGAVYAWETPSLNGSSTYYWKIVPYNSFGEAQGCPVWSFGTVPPGVVILGTQTNNSDFPFYSLYHDARTQMLFTKDELLASGAQANHVIQNIAFDVSQFNNITLNNLLIRIKATDASTLSGFDTNAAGFQTCYLGNRPVSSTGWNSFTFATPFVWNGEDNLLIDVSFNNTSYSSNSKVHATQMPGMTWAQMMDGADGATLSGGSPQILRPNIRFQFSPPIQGLASITDLNIIKLGNHYILNWTLVPEAQWYKIYWSDTPGGTYTPLGTVRGNTIFAVLGSALNSDRVFFIVTAGRDTPPPAKQ